MLKTFTCKYCGNEFTRKYKPSRLKTTRFDFCSPTCRNKARALPLIPCPICGTLFKPKKWNGKGKSPRKYCSRKCSGTASIGRPSTNPYVHPKEVKEFISKNYSSQGAEPISKLFKMTISAVHGVAYKLGLRLDKDVYRQKVHESARSYMKSPNNPNYRTGKTCNEWGSNWQEWKSKVRKRDNYTCQVCGKTARSVHHIKPRRLFIGHMEDANTNNNLITLCSACHVRVDMGKVPCPKPKAVAHQ